MTATQRLAILRELREAAGLSQADAARRIGLTGRQSRLTLGAWENGTFPADEKRRRTALIDYLWDVLRLRRDPTRFAEIWEVLEDAWGWEPLSDGEWRRLNQPPPTPVAAAPPPFQAPASIAHFVGRAAELDELARRLQQPASRVALVGMGGAGKTSLAIEAAHRLRPHFPAGVLWADAAASDPLDILQSWAAAFGRDYSGLRDVASRAAAVRSLLAGKKVLLVLDDVRVAEQVEPLFPGDPDNPIIITTRNEEMAVALHAALLRLAEWSQSESRQLLVELLGEARVGQESEAAAELCSLVHHLPLAVEIAAQFLAMRPRHRLAAMVQRLQEAQNRLDLRISSRDVRTSFAVSWEALDEDHRQLFASLAAFEGRSFALEAAAAVADLDETTTREWLENLQALSLVAEAEDERYRQHPLLADFAAEQLGDRQANWSHFIDYYVRFARQYQHHYVVIESEWENLMAALRRAHEQEWWQFVLDLVVELGEPWFAQARYTQARQGYAWAYEAAIILGEPVSRQAHLLLKWGQACLEQNDYEEAERLFWQAAADQESTPAHVRAGALYALARLARQHSDYTQARQLLTRCQTLYEADKNPIGLAAVLYEEAFLAYQQGDYAYRERLYQEALLVQEAHNDQVGRLQTLRLLVLITLKQGDLAAAEAYCRQALTLASELQNQAEWSSALYDLAGVYRFQGWLEKALAAVEQSIIQFERMGDRRSLALAEYERSSILLQSGDYRMAVSAAQASLQILRILKDEYILVYTLLRLGDAYWQLRERQSALDSWQEALQVGTTHLHPLCAELQVRLQQRLA